VIDVARSRGGRARARAERRSAALSSLQALDWVLLAAVGALVAYGLWAIAGITRFDVEGDQKYYVVRQAVAAGIGVAGLVVCLLVDPDVYRRAKRLLYAGTTGLMLLVFALGEAARGSTRWLNLGFFQFQPSEFGKLLYALALAGFIADRTRKVPDGRTVLATIGLGTVPVLLVFAQPDLGTGMVYSAALAALLFFGGTRLTHLLGLGAVLAAVLLSVLWFLPSRGVEVLKPYQTARLTGFTNPEQDPAGLTYNVSQSITAVGSGGLEGRGVGGASQTRLDYLPEHATDFVFASFAEQRGFFGAAILLLLYVLVVWRGLRVVTVAQDVFSAMVAGAIVAAFLFQVFVNVGMTMGIAPVTGIPLPFVSVGGSSMVANLLAIGVLQAIHARAGGVRRRAR